MEEGNLSFCQQKETSTSVITLCNLVVNLVVNAELRATILQVPDVQAGLGRTAYTYDKI